MLTQISKMLCLLNLIFVNKSMQKNDKERQPQKVCDALQQSCYSSFFRITQEQSTQINTPHYNYHIIKDQDRPSLQRHHNRGTFCRSNIELNKPFQRNSQLESLGRFVYTNKQVMFNPRTIQNRSFQNLNSALLNDKRCQVVFSNDYQQQKQHENVKLNNFDCNNTKNINLVLRESGTQSFQESVTKDKKILQKQKRLQQIQDLKRQLQEINKKIKSWSKPEINIINIENQKQKQKQQISNQNIQGINLNNQNSSSDKAFKCQQKEVTKISNLIMPSQCATNLMRKLSNSSSENESSQSSSPDQKNEWGKKSGCLDSQLLRNSKASFRSKQELHRSQKGSPKQASNDFINCSWLSNQKDSEGKKRAHQMLMQPKLEDDFLDYDDQDFEIIIDDSEQQNKRIQLQSSVSTIGSKQNEEQLKTTSKSYSPLKKSVFKKKRNVFPDDQLNQSDVLKRENTNSSIKNTLKCEKYVNMQKKDCIRGSLKVQGSTFDTKLLISTNTPKKSHALDHCFCKNDFIIIKNMRKAEYGAELLVIHRVTGFICLMRVISKALVKAKQKQKSLLQQIKYGFLLEYQNIQSLYGLFSDEQNIYILLQDFPQIKKLQISQTNEIIAVTKIFLQSVLFAAQKGLIFNNMTLAQIIIKHKYFKIKLEFENIEKIKNQQIYIFGFFRELINSIDRKHCNQNQVKMKDLIRLLQTLCQQSSRTCQEISNFIDSKLLLQQFSQISMQCQQQVDSELKTILC